MISNTGTGAATDVDVVDDLQAGMIYQAGTATASPSAGFTEVSVTPDPNDGSTSIETVWNIASIPAGGSVTITYPVTALPGLPDGTGILNDRRRHGLRAIRSGHRHGQRHDLGVGRPRGKQVLRSGGPVAGGQFTYTIGVENLGPSDATGVRITDPLPAETTFVSAPGCTESSGTVECVVGDLAVGDMEEFVVTVDSRA